MLDKLFLITTNKFQMKTEKKHIIKFNYFKPKLQIHLPKAKCYKQAANTLTE